MGLVDHKTHLVTVGAEIVIIAYEALVAASTEVPVEAGVATDAIVSGILA